MYLRDAALLARDSSNGRGSGGIYTPKSLGHSSPASSTGVNKPAGWNRCKNVSSLKEVTKNENAKNNDFEET